LLASFLFPLFFFSFLPSLLLFFSFYGQPQIREKVSNTPLVLRGWAPHWGLWSQCHPDISGPSPVSTFTLMQQSNGGKILESPHL
jgi:hypothetical protein